MKVPDVGNESMFTERSRVAFNMFPCALLERRAPEACVGVIPTLDNENDNIKTPANSLSINLRLIFIRPDPFLFKRGDFLLFTRLLINLTDGFAAKFQQD